MTSALAGKAFFAAVRPLFGGKLTEGQVAGLKVILSAWDASGDGDDKKLAYLLATTKHETAHTMQPIHERGERAYFDKYEPETKIGKRLGNTKKGDGYRFRGRGYVQLTGRNNYERASDRLGLPLLLTSPPQKQLIGDPDKALVPAIAAMILIKGCLEGWFTTKKLGDYINPSKADYVNARRVINGTDKAREIAEAAETFEAALRAARHANNEAGEKVVETIIEQGIEEAVREPLPEPVVVPPVRNAWAVLITLFLAAAAFLGKLLSTIPGVPS